jgi:hypothetical protein
MAQQYNMSTVMQDVAILFGNPANLHVAAQQFQKWNQGSALSTAGSLPGTITQQRKRTSGSRRRGRPPKIAGAV